MGKISMSVRDRERGVKSLRCATAMRSVLTTRQSDFPKAQYLVSHNYEYVYSTCSSTASQESNRLRCPIAVASRLSDGLKRGENRI